MIYTSPMPLPEWFVPSSTYVSCFAIAPISCHSKLHPTIINTKTGMGIFVTHTPHGATAAIKNWNINPWKCHPGISYFKGDYAAYGYTPQTLLFAVDNAMDDMLDEIFAAAAANYVLEPNFL